jgi:uncharacterized protein
MEVFGVDKNGIIITEVSADKITSPFREIVENILNSILGEFSTQLNAVFLYGSIATGKAVVGKSDLDILIVFNEKLTEELSRRVLSLEEKLTNEYESTLRDVGLATTCVADALSEKERKGSLCFLKHLCVCIYGEDFTKDIPGFKPSREVAKGFNGDIAKVLESFKGKLEKGTGAEEIKKLSQSVAKKIVRTGFSLVMPRSNSWTTNLQTSADTFAYYYPEKAPEMNTSLEWSKVGNENRYIVIEFIDTFGVWLTREFEKEIIGDS